MRKLRRTVTVNFCGAAKSSAINVSDTLATTYVINLQRCILLTGRNILRPRTLPDDVGWNGLAEGVEFAARGLGITGDGIVKFVGTAKFGINGGIIEALVELPVKRDAVVTGMGNCIGIEFAEVAGF